MRTKQGARSAIIISTTIPPFYSINLSWDNIFQDLNTVKTQVIGRCAMSLELPPLVRSGVFLFFYACQGG